ncbi:HdeD family acid-resistance protein [Enterococcus sp. AZ109]|uniref:HdeD family acid-resistance protein n=1 Tax=Enterococcus sp. AZ109 TaxID=2774634 RepID=UPI003F28038B
MSTFLDSMKRFSYFRGIIYLLLGIAILISPRVVFDAIVYIIFFYVAALGVLQLISGFRNRQQMGGWGPSFSGGIVMLVVAFVILFFARGIVSILPMFLGFIVLIFGIGKFMQNWDARKRGFSVTGGLVYSGVMILAGILLLFNPFNSLMLLFRFFGFLLITMSIAEIRDARLLSRK